jgi:hypothetical protein
MIAKQALAIFLLAVLVACSSAVPPNSLVPTPESACQTALNWKGIIPGKSTKRDVRRILGEPTHKGREIYVDGRVPFYAYKIEDGAIAGLAEDRIFFGKNGIVAWIEVTVADRDGQTHTVQEMVEELGATVDQVYINNNYRVPDQYDVVAGPDQIYVWAECGLAASAVSPVADDPTSVPGLTVRYPVPPSDSLQPTPNAGDVIMFKFFFPQTSFAGFEEFYKDKVPFYLIYIWKEYLQRREE